MVTWRHTGGQSGPGTCRTGAHVAGRALPTPPTLALFLRRPVRPFTPPRQLCLQCLHQRSLQRPHPESVWGEQTSACLEPCARVLRAVGQSQGCGEL